MCAQKIILYQNILEPQIQTLSWTLSIRFSPHHYVIVRKYEIIIRDEITLYEGRQLSNKHHHLFPKGRGPGK